MSKFHQLEDDVQHVCRTLRDKTRQLSGLSGERKKLAMREAERVYEEGREAVRQMHSLARQSPATAGSTSTINQLEQNLTRLKREFDEIGDLYCFLIIFIK